MPENREEVIGLSRINSQCYIRPASAAWDTDDYPLLPAGSPTGLRRSYSRRIRPPPIITPSLPLSRVTGLRSKSKSPTRSEKFDDEAQRSPSVYSQASYPISFRDWATPGLSPTNEAKKAFRTTTWSVSETSGYSSFSVEYPVPAAIQTSDRSRWHQMSNTDGREFSHLRYTAATCDPSDFTIENGFNLRSSMNNRHTELLVAITVYNEDKKLFCQTLQGVVQCIASIVKQGASSFWNDTRPAWEKICVCLAIDGMNACDKDNLDILAAIGLYQDGIAKKTVDGKDTVAHIFEYTTQLHATYAGRFLNISPEQLDEVPPIQMILCLKQDNLKKINSHRWLLGAFGQILNPEICVLLDAGTKPNKGAFTALWRKFSSDQNLGGACGEISPTSCSLWKKQLMNPLVAAQNFEYKISSILDKALESSFGYLTVLPGAFSAYRYRAIAGGPMEQYFKGDPTLPARKRGHSQMSVFEKNMFLAEDRVLCFEVVAKPNSKWHLTYVREAKGETDVPQDPVEFLHQRRRWINGSFAAWLYTLLHFKRLYGSGHHLTRLFFFHVQLTFNVVVQLLTWFSLATYWLTSSILMDVASTPFADGTGALLPSTGIVNNILKYVYLGTLLLQFVVALGNRPGASRYTYMASFAVFLIIQFYVVIISICLTIVILDHHLIGRDSTVLPDSFFSWWTIGYIVVALATNFGLYLLASIMYFDPWHMFTSFFQYLLFSSPYVNVVNVYAFCNWHDVSWGTKGSNQVDALPSAQSVLDYNEGLIIEEPVISLKDIDLRFEQTVKRALTPWRPPKDDKAGSIDDVYKTMRTNLLASWIFSNAMLVVLITNKSPYELNLTTGITQRTIYFFQIFLLATAWVAVMRFMGCCWFLLGRMKG